MDTAEDLEVARERDDEHRGGNRATVKAARNAATVPGFEDRPQRGLGFARESQHACDLAGDLALNLRERRERDMHTAVRGERRGPVRALREHRLAARDVVAKRLG